VELFDGYRRAMLQREASIIKQTKPGGNLLDIGCATGTFFHGFKGAEWHLFGLDTSKLGVETARMEHGATVFCGTLPEARYPSRFFDVVTMLDALYYLPDPVAELREIHRILKDDGVLAIEIPGLAYTLAREQGPLCWLMDRKWRRGLANSFHLYYFSSKTIRSLLSMAGFTLLQMFPEQASFRGGIIDRALNEIHFSLARLLHWVSARKVSISAKEFYLAVKVSSVAADSLPSS
jgi:SAM-dependent methyltransferase